MLLVAMRVARARGKSASPRTAWRRPGTSCLSRLLHPCRRVGWQCKGLMGGRACSPAGQPCMGKPRYCWGLLAVTHLHASEGGFDENGLAFAGLAEASVPPWLVSRRRPECVRAQKAVAGSVPCASSSLLAAGGDRVGWWCLRCPRSPSTRPVPLMCLCVPLPSYAVDAA